MKERPIILSASEVRAVFGGHKTQHRVPVILLKIASSYGLPLLDKAWVDGSCLKVPYCGNGDPSMETTQRIHCPQGSPGDRLWVKETWRIPNGAPKGWVDYKADDAREGFCWRSPAVMPRHASRITLEIVSVRVERVQEISEEDARAEGCPHGGRGDLNSYGAEILATRVEWFRRCWDSRYAKRGFGWDANPWVWVRELRRVER